MTPEAQRRLAYRLRNSGKRCPRCGEVRPITDWGADAHRPDGLARICKPCRAEEYRVSKDT